VEINGMKLTDPMQAYSLLWNKLTGGQTTPKQAAILLNTKFSPKNKPIKKTTTVIFVDEMDYLLNKKQNVLYSFFEWPTRKNVPVVVIGISNTMNLPEHMQNRVQSRLGLSRILFKPYTNQQLETIITTRLQGLDAFDASAVSFCSKRIASVSGDARRALELCRRAAAIAEREYAIKQTSAALDPNEPERVNFKHLDKALEEMYLSNRTQAIKNSSLHERLFLCAVVLELRSTGLVETTFGAAVDRHFLLCQTIATPVPSISALLAVCDRLGSLRLVVIESCRTSLDKKIILNVSSNDVTFSMKDDPIASQILPFS